MQEYDCVRKRKGTDGQFGTVEEGVRAMLERFPAGKILFVSDRSCPSVFKSVSLLPRALFAVLTGEGALPLFALPCDVRCVIAAGGKQALTASRVYASIMGVPSLLFPTDACAFGCFERAAEPRLGGVNGQIELNESEVRCDLRLMRASMGRALAGLYLSRLALFEHRALSLMKRQEKHPAYEQLFALLSRPAASEEEIVQKNLALRKAEADGLFAGEGRALAAARKTQGDACSEWHAFLELSALYAAVLKKGKPRRYFTPDYAARFERAGLGEEGYCTAEIPTTAQYALRAIALERARGELLNELNGILQKRGMFSERLRRYAPCDLTVPPSDALKCLPEWEPRGLTAIFRDFGLMEF